MPRIFDNIEKDLLGALRETLQLSQQADFCVGYFNLRGWKQIDGSLGSWQPSSGQVCRVMVGMQSPPQEELKRHFGLDDDAHGIDNQAVIRFKKQIAQDFRQQLTFGIPTNDDEKALQRLAQQLRDGVVQVRLFLRHRLHAKLYLMHRPDPINPVVGYLGSSNLTFSGLSGQGELNVDVLDGDACNKLSKWFEDRWKDRFCVDISQDLLEILGESWARSEVLSPYRIYVKMAYHLSQEARAGLSEFRIPRDFGNQLFDYQTAAVKIAAHHLNRRNGVLLGDVVGLGKSLMATALARIFEDDHGLETLILCPKNLVTMWEDYRERYRLRAKIIPFSTVGTELADLRRYRLVLIDESHNLRNREGRRYQAIRDYIQKNDSKCILLSATPYNKAYADLANQLRLFLEEDEDIGLRPEALLREMGEIEFVRKHQCGTKTIAAFEKSCHPDDWRELMRLFMVRRTRSFIQMHYASQDPQTGRRFLTYESGEKSWFPERKPRTVKFEVREKSKSDQYARLFSSAVVNQIASLHLPRYGLGNYVAPSPAVAPSGAEAKILDDLGRAGKRLMGFCRTNLFKRLESSGASFVQSIERHILRNNLFLHALDNGLPLPLGAQDAAMLDASLDDTDEGRLSLDEEDSNTEPETTDDTDYRAKASQLYQLYSTAWKRRFKWIRSDLFAPKLREHLAEDAAILSDLLTLSGSWDPSRDTKLQALVELLKVQHPDRKVLIFTQFADTAAYLLDQLRKAGIERVAAATGQSEDPTTLAHRFSPESNRKTERIPETDRLRVLIATDVLSEGQNLQDCHVVVNFDLPWAIIRLIQRAGRVDRIGQKSPEILCYTFLPADGVERIIRLRARVRQRLTENAEVVGTDESFFENDGEDQQVLDLYNEKAGLLDGDGDTEVDLSSYAYQIWKNAIERDPKLVHEIPSMPDVVYSSRPHQPFPRAPEGVLVFLRTPEGNDALAFMDRSGKSVTESQWEILKLAECSPDMPAQPRHEHHHEIVHKGVSHILQQERSRPGGQLGRPSGARFKCYERLKAHAEKVRGTLFESPDLLRAIDDLLRAPLRQTATEILNRQLKAGIDDTHLAELAISLRDEDRLCLSPAEAERQSEARLLCSLGLFAPEGPIS
ncbi:MAG TPA: helicase-related protein [Fibrobacteria bacterium]|nr:helicase-related protein [Fibrobacteria bacterium]